MKVIGITGPTGAGKTTALKAIEALGGEIIDADLVYHSLLQNNRELKKALVGAFGEGILDEGGRVDRKKLSQVVYPDRLEELNGLTHPAVVAEIDRMLAVARGEKRPCAAIDAIALVESGLGDRCDSIVAVLAPLEVRVRRIMARDGIDEEYARRRALAQKDEAFFRSHADYVLENKEWDTPRAFAARARRLFRKLTEG